VKVDLVAHKFPLVRGVENVAGVRMNSLLDIGAMKLNAIYNSGRRLKDFVDVYALLEFFPLKKLIEAGERKYEGINGSMLKNALVYFKDIDFRYEVDFVGREIKWLEIEDRLRNAIQYPERVFGSRQMQASNELEKKRSRIKGKSKGLGM